VPQSSRDGHLVPDESEFGTVSETGGGSNGDSYTTIATHGINGNARPLAQERGSVLAFHDLFAAIETVGSYVMAPVRFTRGRIDGKRRTRQRIVGTTHVAAGPGFLVLLNSHEGLLN